jgi:DNA replication ATP-dependent helicase Dna2
VSSQVALLLRMVARHPWSDVEVLTIDKCQGRDKPALLLSLVKSNAENLSGRLLADWRRVNVAVTRAQRKLVMVGSRQTLTKIPLFEELLDLMIEKNWLSQLPANVI